MKKLSSVLAFILLISLSYSLTIRMQSGTTLTGTMAAKQNQNYYIATTDGTIMVPVNSVISITDQESDLTKVYLDLPDFGNIDNTNNQTQQKPEKKKQTDSIQLSTGTRVLYGVLAVVSLAGSIVLLLTL